VIPEDNNTANAAITITKQRSVMNLLARRQPSRLPKRFPVGTTYVVEDRTGQNDGFRVFSRYVVLPSGARINVAGDFGSPRVTARDRPLPHL
jgi:hypothetical protein